MNSNAKPNLNRDELLLINKSVNINLLSNNKVSFMRPPDKLLNSNQRFGSIIKLDTPKKEAVYKISLSKEGWVDVIQNDAFVKSIDHSGAKNCKLLRKSVKFLLKAVPTIIQISNVPADEVSIIVTPE